MGAGVLWGGRPVCTRAPAVPSTCHREAHEPSPRRAAGSSWPQAGPGQRALSAACFTLSGQLTLWEHRSPLPCGPPGPTWTWSSWSRSLRVSHGTPPGSEQGQPGGPLGLREEGKAVAVAACTPDPDGGPGPAPTPPSSRSPSPLSAWRSPSHQGKLGMLLAQEAFGGPRELPQRSPGLGPESGHFWTQGSPTEAAMPFVLAPDSHLRSAAGRSPPRISTFNPQLTSRPPWARAFHCAETEESLRHRGEGNRVCEAPPAARQKSPKQKTFLPSERSAREPTSGFNLQALGLSYHVGALLGGDGPGGARAHGAHRAKPRIMLGEGPRWVRVPADGGEGAEQPASRPSLGNPFPLWGLETLESPCASREQTRSAPAPRSLSRDAGIPRPTAAHRGPCHLPDHAPDS